MHPLTKLLHIEHHSDSDHIIQSWAKERTEWLKKELCAEGYHSVIDQAFQVKPELEDKIDEIIEAAKYTKVLENEHTKKACIDKIIATVREYDFKK